MAEKRSRELGKDLQPSYVTRGGEQYGEILSDRLLALVYKQCYFSPAQQSGLTSQIGIFTTYGLLMVTGEPAAHFCSHIFVRGAKAISSLIPVPLAFICFIIYSS
jgi:hypothetical protein